MQGEQREIVIDVEEQQEVVMRDKKKKVNMTGDEERTNVKK